MNDCLITGQMIKCLSRDVCDPFRIGNFPHAIWLPTCDPFGIIPYFNLARDNMSVGIEYCPEGNPYLIINPIKNVFFIIFNFKSFQMS